MAPAASMSEARRDSTSSLQRKKPPWLKLDIPVAAPPTAEESSSLQVSSGQQGLWAHPTAPLPRDPVAQPLRRQVFLRSVSMPAEAAHVPSPYHEPRRPALQRQMSITQTIRRYKVTSPHSIDWDWWGTGKQLGGASVGVGAWNWAGPLLSWLCHSAPPSSRFHLSLPLHPFSTRSLLLCFLHPALWPLSSRQVHFGCVHTLPLLGSPAARRALPQCQSLSRSLLRYSRHGTRVLA